MTSTLKSQALVQALMDKAFIGEAVLFLFRILPYLAMWAAFVFLYIFMPNIKVRLPAALIGGIVGGTLWQLAQWAYVTFQVGMARYNAIYGTLAALPILMAWIYISWLIVLFGAELAYVWQNLNIIRQEVREQKVNYLSQEMVALTIMATVSHIFERGEPPWKMERIAERLGLPPRLARIVIDELVNLGYIAEVISREDEDCCYQPARPPGKVRVDEIIQNFRGSGATIGEYEDVPEWEMVREIERRIALAAAEVLHGMTLADLTPAAKE
jgi:membrane protein